MTYIIHGFTAGVFTNPLSVVRHLGPNQYEGPDGLARLVDVLC